MMMMIMMVILMILDLALLTAALLSCSTLSWSAALLLVCWVHCNVIELTLELLNLGGYPHCGGLSTARSSHRSAFCAGLNLNMVQSWGGEK